MVAPDAGAEIRDELRLVARDLLARSAAEKGVDWSLLAESGWLGLEVPEALDGSGATFAEVAVILEEMGRAATGGPYLGSVVLGVGALDLLDPSAERDQLLTEVAAGETLVAVAAVDGEVDTLAGDPPFRVERSSDGTCLHGRSAFVPDVVDADRLLLLADDGDGGPVVVVVDAPTTSLTITPQPLVDESRRFGLVEAAGVVVDDTSVWPFRAEVASPGARLIDRAALAVACDSLGLSEAMLDATVAYAGSHEQFGRPIGSFQAVKHACADMLVQVTVARELVSAAVSQLAAGDPEASVAVSMAKAYACGAAVDVVGKAMQLHGGIGYTWESGVHTYLKRAVLDRALFGSPAVHRRRIAQRYA